MADFVQIVEFQTSRIDEIQALADQRRAQPEPSTAPGRVTVTADRDRPGYYLVIAEFDSYESAMEHSNLPETGEFAAEMAKLCEGPAKFSNLDVRQAWSPSGG